jgi:hypothetical protein
MPAGSDPELAGMPIAASRLVRRSARHRPDGDEQIFGFFFGLKPGAGLSAIA